MSEIKEEEVQYGNLFRAAGTGDEPVMFVNWTGTKSVSRTEGKSWVGIYLWRDGMNSYQSARRGFKGGYWERVNE